MKNTLNIILLNFSFLAFGALAPLAQAVSPPPDGGYPGLTTAEGQNALKNLTTGSANTGVGWFSLFSDTVGSFNTAVGTGTLALNIADSNTATGTAALILNTSGTRNTANGTAALVYNSTGNDNTAVGAFALNNNTASGNTAIGSNALLNNTTGSNNTAIGDGALAANTDGSLHTAVGFHALANNIASETGINTAVGTNALSANTTGGENTAVGNFTLPFNTIGSLNTALGFGAGAGILTVSNVTCIGPVSGVSTVAGEVGDSCYIAHIHDQPVDSGTAQFVFVDEDGKLGTTNFSSQRFKKEVRPMDQTSEAVLALKPVTFQYKNDKKCAPQFGLIAEEVVKVNPDLVVHDKKGQVVAVRYDAVNAMLLNEFLKEHKKVEQQQARISELNSRVSKQEGIIAQQQKGMEALTAQLKEQAAQIQKVSAQVEVNRPAPQLARNKAD
jgi:trimeric autotransporter adhesin